MNIALRNWNRYATYELVTGPYPNANIAAAECAEHDFGVLYGVKVEADSRQLSCKIVSRCSKCGLSRISTGRNV